MSCKYSLVYCLTKGFLKSTPFPWKILFPIFLDFPYKQLKILFHRSPISIFLALGKCLVCLFRCKIFWKIWYDFKIVSYFLFEKFHIILNIPTSWQYILLLCTKKMKKIMNVSNRVFSYLRTSRFYLFWQKRPSKYIVTGLVLYNFTPQVLQHLQIWFFQKFWW